ncbi:MAG: anhydro-N-acetylmuramic acid kinase [Flavobacteriales bacterium]|nr:anhydro-N-acetylmuramic acid kinase [Flavobacteriales bacterium]|tara:strand:+ start:37933 stop:38985 length:1053 start_codon:yes stop_codon:yes gene_type:complete
MIYKNNIYTVLGVMSGTSLDGVDFALCTFEKNETWKFKIKKCNTINYNKTWRNTLQNLHKENKETIAKVNIEYGKYLAGLINTFLDKDRVDFISSHGHTIFHAPNNNYTLQIGDGNIISQKTQLTTINDFRSLDVSLGGQGAPLVPIGDLHLFQDYKYCINLGGFANISIKENNSITAFDICPVNIVMNLLSKKLGKEYDENGCFAKNGILVPKLLEKLNALAFYQQKPPKSLGREWVENFINPIILTYKSEDVLNTLCEHIAMQISKHLTDKKVLFTGGGVYNKYLMNRIKHYSNAQIIIPSKKIIDYKEALIFAFLGVLRSINKVNCLRSVTGATRDNCGGIIHNPLS